MKTNTEVTRANATYTFIIVEVLTGGFTSLDIGAAQAIHKLLPI
jgi:hypothetical protein